MEQCFFFSADSGKELLFTTASLSQKTLAGPSKGMPNIRNLYRRPSTSSVAIRSAIYSEPNVDVSIVF